MSESLITLALVVAASIYIGVLIGRKNSRSLAKQLVLQERERVRAEVKQEQTQIAAELHGELAKVRNSIIQSAHAYQHVVKTIGDKLAPWEDVQKALQIESPKDLPLLIAEEPETAVAQTKQAEGQPETEKSPQPDKAVWQTTPSRTESTADKSWSTGATKESNTLAVTASEAPTAEMAIAAAAGCEVTPQPSETGTLIDEIVTEGVSIHGAESENSEPQTAAVAKERFISSTRSLH